MEIKLNLDLIYFFLTAEFCLVFLILAVFFSVHSRKYRRLYLRSTQSKSSSSSFAGRDGQTDLESRPAKGEASESPAGKEESDREEAEKWRQEREKLSEKLAALEKTLEEKDQKIASLESSHTSLEKEYQVLYRQQQHGQND